MKARRIPALILAAMSAIALPGCEKSETAGPPGHSHLSAVVQDGEGPGSAAPSGSPDGDGQQADRTGDSARADLGLMSSLPLYWSPGADFGQLAQGTAAVPWQRVALERDYDLVLLDTISPIAALDPEAPDTDPLANLDRLAIVQPRGLSPSDNVALDRWVRDGGRLLLVLDPMLTGHYELPLGDPRRPTDTALIPPVVKRWGMKVLYDDRQEPERMARSGDITIPVSLGGEIRIDNADAPSGDCRIGDQGVIARCDIGDGRVTLIADAFAFEEPHGGQTQSPIVALLRLAFND